MQNNAKAIRDWLMSGRAGLFVGYSPQDCLQRAWGASTGLGMSMGEFTDCLHAEGFRPDMIRSKVWHLKLPDMPNK